MINLAPLERRAGNGDRILVELYRQLLEKENVRANLSELRKIIKDEDNKQKFIEMVENVSDLTQFLSDEDPKSRKNVALLLGDMGCQPAKDAIFEAYKNEGTLFVKAHYLEALNHLEVEDIVDELKTILEARLEEEVAPENVKHIESEIAKLRQIIIRYDGITRHKFVMPQDKVRVVLTCNRGVRGIVKRTVMESRVGLHPLGVLVETSNLPELLKVRTYKEVIFPLGLKHLLPADPKEAAKALWEADLYDAIKKYHDGPDDYYFRIELKSHMNLDERSQFTRKFGTELERLSKNQLVNSASDYEVEIRLVETTEGKFYPALKFYTLVDNRFDYRKNSISTSIHPSMAAIVAEVSRRYLKDNAQVMDPFCGVGTMLIERNKVSSTKAMYATDIYGKAIENGRENAYLAKADINFINRNFFDFKHDYLFDEIFTNMPTKGPKTTKRDLDFLYARFFDKAREILTRDGIIVMYTNEAGFVKKQLRFHTEYRILQETPMQDRANFEVLVIAVVR